MNRSDSYDESNISPYGKFVEYTKPHSPFQKPIDSLRKRHGLFSHEFAERIGVSQATLRIWLHNIDGFPHSKSFNSEHVRRLGEVLQIPQSRTKSAFDAALFDMFITSSGRLGVDHVIWNHNIWSAQKGGPRTYTVKNRPHTDHVRVAFTPNGSQSRPPLLLTLLDQVHMQVYGTGPMSNI